MTIEPGWMLLHYRLVEKIGEGGMGAVWKAVDTTRYRTLVLARGEAYRVNERET